MLALAGAGATTCLNFADSAELLAVPASSYRSLDEVRNAVLEAVEDFAQQEALGTEEDAMSDTCSSSTPSSPLTDDDEESSSSPFELDVLSDMGSDMYYASLAQGMLMAPPFLATSPAALCDLLRMGVGGA